jgi:hypothetical protein
VDDGGFGGDEVTESVGGVIAARAINVGIDFQDVFGTTGIVLKVGQAFD